jgi:hypothetical protein
LTGAVDSCMILNKLQSEGQNWIGSGRMVNLVAKAVADERRVAEKALWKRAVAADPAPACSFRTAAQGRKGRHDHVRKTNPIWRRPGAKGQRHTGTEQSERPDGHVRNKANFGERRGRQKGHGIGRAACKTDPICRDGRS